MPIKKDDSLLSKARELRRNMTPHERKLWYLFLRTYPVKIYKQRIIASSIAEFYCAAAKLVIELDGSQHYEDAASRYDLIRTDYMESLGLMVLRFTNQEIDREFDAVCELIDRAIRSRGGTHGG